MSNADALSRLPVEGITGEEENCLNVLHISNELFISVEEIKEATMNDKSLKLVYEYVKNGWPTEINKEIKHYHLKRNSLACENDCLFYGERIVVPIEYRLK